MWSCFDYQVNRYMQSGINSDTLEDCIDGMWSWWYNAQDEFNEEEVAKIAKDKKGWIESLEFEFQEHSDRLDEEE